MTVRTRGASTTVPSAPRVSGLRRVLVGIMVVSLIAIGGFFIGRRTAPSHRHPLVGSLDRSLDVTVGPCTREPTTVSTPGIKIPATIVWRSAWKDDEFPFRRAGSESNVHIGVSWDNAVWAFADIQPAPGRGTGWGVGPYFTPSGNAAERWARREARRRGVLDSALPLDIFMQRLGPSQGVWVLENFYTEKPQARWAGGFNAYNVPAGGPKPSSATFAMIDVDGSVIEKTIALTCS
jgi:hypothetical protein